VASLTHQRDEGGRRSKTPLASRQLADGWRCLTQQRILGPARGKTTEELLASAAASVRPTRALKYS